MSKEKKKQLQNISYQKKNIKIYYPVPIRKGCCVACERCRGEGIKITQLHHAKYAYETKTVLKNPVLALDNTLELCFGCHPVADGFRDMLLSNPRGALRSINRIVQVLKFLPKEQQDHFTSLARTWLKERK